VDEPLQAVELARWGAHLASLADADRKLAEGAWARARTNQEKRALIAAIPRELPVDKDGPPLTRAELKVWNDYLNDLDARDRKQAEAEWAKARTNKARRALVNAIKGGEGA
jgi:hypothetical protein